MNRFALIALAPLVLATPALAQHEHHDHPSPAAPDPHAGHTMPAPAAAAPDPHAGHTMPAAAPAAVEAPPAPVDHAADAVWGAEAMAAARRTLKAEHGGVLYSKVMLETAEFRPSSDGDAYAWQGQASYGGDIHRFVLKSEGEGESDGVEAAEAQALYARAIGPYFNLEAGLRHDFEPVSTSYAVLGVSGLAPYWFEVGAAAFLSEDGDVTARLEGSYDLRLTQKLILEPNVEVNLAAQDVPGLGLGSGLTDLEAGLRLRYAIQPEFAPYVGVLHHRKLGETADLAADDSDTRLVVGLRAWF